MELVPLTDTLMVGKPAIVTRWIPVVFFTLLDGRPLPARRLPRHPQGDCLPSAEMTAGRQSSAAPAVMLIVPVTVRASSDAANTARLPTSARVAARPVSVRSTRNWRTCS